MMLNKIISFSAILLVILASHAQGATNAQISALGCLSVKQYGAVGNGTTDDTAAIRNCIAAAKAATKAVLFPPGTYLVSDTIDFSRILPWNGSSYPHTREGNVTQLIGSTRDGGRPVILLKNNATGFNNPASPKEVLFAECRNADAGPNPGKLNIGAMFNQGIRNLEVRVGTGNAGAVGLYFPASQSCFLEDFTVDLSNGGYAGIWGLPGVQCSTSNIEVIGGRYGIAARQATQGMGYPSLSNIRLINQTVAAIGAYNSQPLSLVGFEITKAAAPAIVTINQNDAYANIGLMDGSIEFTSTNGSAAVDNTSDCTFTMTNVWVKNASKIVENPGTASDVNGGSGWYKVTEHIYPEATGSMGINLVNGSLNTNTYTTVDASSAPPDDVRTRHGWNEADYPSPDDIYDRIHDSGYSNYDPSHYAISSEKGVVSGGADCWSALQNCINNYDTVLLVKGEYYIGQPVTLRDGTRLIGVGNIYTGIQPHDSWNPTQANPGALITTVDSATADPKMAHLKLTFPVQPDSRDWFSHIHWKAGRNSESRTIFPNIGYGGSDYSGANPKSNGRISGNGGGQHWGGFTIGMKRRYDGNVNFRQLLVESTSEPLLFYNLNVEDTGDGYGAEFRNCSNVFLYGTKSEGERPYYFNGCTNSGVIDTPGGEVILKNNCNNMYASQLNNRSVGSGAPGYHISETYNSVLKQASGSVGVFKRGTINWDDLYINPGQSGDTTPPAAPTGLTANGGEGQVALNWNDNSEPDLKDYRVWRSTQSGSDGEAIATVSQSTYTDASVQGGTTYYYRVAARDQSSNESPKSNQAQATPQAPANPKIAFTAIAPVVDGVVDVWWNESTASTIDHTISGTVSSASDCSGSFQALWDMSNIYFLVNMTDDLKVNDSGTAFHKDDSIEIFIDADNSKSGEFGDDDFQFQFRWHASTPDFKEVKHSAITGVSFAVVGISGGYRLECSIPWTTLLETPVQGHSIGLDIQVNDDDDGDARDGKIAWYGTADTAWEDPGTFGTADLVNSSSVNFRSYKKYW